MAKYFRYFESQGGYDSANIELPNVSYISENNKVYINPSPDMPGEEGGG